MIDVVIFTPYTFPKSRTIGKPPGINPKDGTIGNDGYSIVRRDIFDTTRCFRGLIYATIDVDQWNIIQESKLIDAGRAIEKLSRENGLTLADGMRQEIEKQLWKIYT